MKRGDFIILALIALVALLPYALMRRPAGEAQAVQVYVDGRLVRSEALFKDKQFLVRTDYGDNTVSIQGGRARILAAGCPDLSCVRQGAISRPGETLVCLPHRLTLRITGQDLDAVTGGGA